MAIARPSRVDDALRIIGGVGGSFDRLSEAPPHLSNRTRVTLEVRRRECDVARDAARELAIQIRVIEGAALDHERPAHGIAQVFEQRHRQALPQGLELARFETERLEIVRDQQMLSEAPRIVNPIETRQVEQRALDRCQEPIPTAKILAVTLGRDLAKECFPFSVSRSRRRVIEGIR